VLFSSRVGVRIRCNVWLVSCYAYVFVLLSTVIVILPSRGSCWVKRVGVPWTHMASMECDPVMGAWERSPLSREGKERGHSLPDLLKS